MFAHTIVDFTGPDDVQWSEAAEPAPDGGVVIDVVAAGVSFAELCALSLIAEPWAKSC
jgi:NADPH:quinone reductase-like Zn-dependent oxidoreductase